MHNPAGDLRRWKIGALVATLVIVLVFPVYVLEQRSARSGRASMDPAPPAFVGRGECVGCHQQAYESWLGSDHDLAMDVASDSTVRGDFDDATFSSSGMRARFFKRDGRFFVNTQGPDGIDADFEIAYTFGVEPLQQYLVPFPGGRLQALSIAWDTEREEWFFLYPGQDIPNDDWLHWTRGAQNWNGMCAECHSTNLIKNYDPGTKSFATTWSEIDVSCEACHGPGSRHVRWAKIPPMARPEVDDYDLVIPTGAVSSRQQVELCAPCHSRRRELGDYDHTHPDLMDNIVPAVLEPHLYHSDGQIMDEVYVYGSFLQSKMYRNEVRCGDCHDVHSLTLKKEGNDLCLQCHQAEVYDSYDHHFHKREHEGKPSDGHLCVKCHMPEQPFMVVDWRADHSIRVPRPDLSLEMGTPNACSQVACHDDQPVEWSARHYAEWYGKARKPHYGTILAAGQSLDPAARDPLVRLVDNRLYPSIVRATALSLLQAYPGEESTEAFRRALSDEESMVRYTAVQNAAAPTPEALVGLIAPLLFDHVAAVRMEAAVRLAGLPRELFKDYQREALEETLTEYIAATTYSLDFAFAGHNLGNLYTQLDQPEKAIAYYRAAIEIDDLFFPAKMNLAMLYNASGENAEAERLLREVVSDHPDQYEAMYSLGLLLAEMGRMPEAAAMIERAADGLPLRTRLHYNLGLLQQQLGDLDAAEANLSRALAAEPDHMDYLFALADHYIQRGQPAKAMPLAQRMIVLNPRLEIGYQVKAHIESLTGPRR